MSCETKSKLVSGVLGYHEGTGEIIHFGNADEFYSHRQAQNDGQWAMVDADRAFALLSGKPLSLTARNKAELLEVIGSDRANKHLVTSLGEAWRGNRAVTDDDWDLLFAHITHDPTDCYIALLGDGNGNHYIPPRHLPQVWGTVLADTFLVSDLAYALNYPQDEIGAALCAAIEQGFSPDNGLDALRHGEEIPENYQRALWHAVGKDASHSRRALDEYKASLPDIKTPAYRMLALDASDMGGDFIPPDDMTEEQRQIVAEGLRGRSAEFAGDVSRTWGKEAKKVARDHEVVSQEIMGWQRRDSLTSEETARVAQHYGLARDALFRHGSPYPEKDEDVALLWESVAKSDPLALLRLYPTRGAKWGSPPTENLAELRALAQENALVNIIYCAECDDEALSSWGAELLHMAAQDSHASSLVFRGRKRKTAVRPLEEYLATQSPEKREAVFAMARTVLNRRGADGLALVTSDEDYHYLREALSWSSPPPINLPYPDLRHLKE
jgi:hypothetical protein